MGAKQQKVKMGKFLIDYLRYRGSNQIMSTLPIPIVFQVLLFKSHLQVRKHAL